eukprot:NODE_2185_length_822_cov_54.347995_g1529_i0.p4 GENE.NODE_2185_length_822_cov_54.347995_g1529_i0~~NODE_2185_length_822_cov_54.347995_g1529_i0.p4  ORF type:complete len:53 (-),score=2.54 NODE_2185_length_822_cov_54.347995_g1529_i0:426-584(-)
MVPLASSGKEGGAGGGARARRTGGGQVEANCIIFVVRPARAPHSPTPRLLHA